MTARRVAYRQCDLERAIRAAKATGTGPVMVRPDGTIVVGVGAMDSSAGRRKDRLGEPKGVVL